MIASVRTKPQKKQPSSLPQAAAGLHHELEIVLITLESVCMRILESRFTANKRDVERLYWQQRFKNIVTPVSLALAETKGPRHFHNHYRHSEKDDGILQPVFEDPIETLALVCKDALRHCQQDLVGIEDDAIIEKRDRLEAALRGFLLKYRENA
jgi:hypothetical protein